MTFTAGAFEEEVWVLADEIPAHPVARLIAIVKSKTADIWITRLVVRLLIWKPGDDSRYI